MPMLQPSVCPPMRRCWFASPAAQALVAAEQRELIPLLTSHIGVRGLFLRPDRGIPSALSGNMLQSVASLHRDGRPGRFSGEVDCSEQALPFDSDSLCLIYALHALDTCEEPLRMVEELARVLRPDGVMFLVGLSSNSLWRMRWARAGMTRCSASRSRGLLLDCGLTVEAQQGIGPVWPAARVAVGLQGGQDSTRSSTLPGKPGWVLLARKRRPTMTPVGRRSRSAVGLLAQVRPG